MSISLSGSLLLTGSIVASGNLTTTGTITAQTLVVQTITSSIVNITGSNIFGSRTTDRQTFTGSLFITGSSANFSNQVCGLMGNFSCVGIGMTSPQTSLHLIRSLGSDVMSIGESGTNTRFAIGQEASYTGNYINSRNIDLKIQAYCAGGSGGNIIFQTGTDGTGCVNTKVFICSNGNMGIGTTSMSTESNLFLGANTTLEGGQLTLQKGTACSCATHLDNFQDSFRVLVGTDVGSTGVNMLIDHKTRNVCFYGSMLMPTLNTFIQSCAFSLPANTSRTITLCGTTNGFIQINLGMYGNGTGNQARGMWIGGGYLGGSSLAYSELVRVGQTFLCVGSIASNASSTQLVVGNCFGSNSADVTFAVISGTANQAPVNIFLV